MSSMGVMGNSTPISGSRLRRRNMVHSLLSGFGGPFLFDVNADVAQFVFLAPLLQQDQIGHLGLGNGPQEYPKPWFHLLSCEFCRFLLGPSNGVGPQLVNAIEQGLITIIDSVFAIKFGKLLGIGIEEDVVDAQNTD